MKIPPKLKIWGQTAQIPKLFIKKITQNFNQNFFLMFSPASKHLKFYYMIKYSRFRQVQAIYMYGAAQPDFLKSETNGGIKNIISHHLEIIKRCVF